MSQTQTSKPQEFVINLYDIETNPSGRHESKDWCIETRCDVSRKTQAGLELLLTQSAVSLDIGSGYFRVDMYAIRSYAAIDLVAQENSKTVTYELPAKKLPSNQVYEISCHANNRIIEINDRYEQMDYVKTHTLEKCVEEVKALESKVFTCTLETSSEVTKQIHETYQKRRYVSEAIELYGHMKNYQAKLIADKAQVPAGGQ